jgi:hypothetical protein
VRRRADHTQTDLLREPVRRRRSRQLTNLTVTTIQLLLTT